MMAAQRTAHGRAEMERRGGMAARSHIGGGKRVSNDPCAAKPEQAKAASPTASPSGFSELAEPRMAALSIGDVTTVDTQGAWHFQTLHATNTLLWRVNIHLTWPAVRCRDAVRSRWRHERRGAALALLLQRCAARCSRPLLRGLRRRRVELH